MTNNSITVQDAVQAFLTSKYADGKSENTMNNYERTVQAFARHTGLIAVQQISADLCVDFLNNYGVDKSDTYRRQIAVELRVFMSYLVEVRLLDESPAFDLPIVAERLVRLLRPDEWLTAYKQLKLRDQTLMHLITETGLMLNEIPSLRWGDIDEQRGLVRITATNGATRCVPIDGHLLAALTKLKARMQKNGISTNPNDPVYVGPGGVGLNRQGIEGVLRRAQKKTGVPLSAETLRYFCAFHAFYSEGVPLDALREMLGHSDIEITVDMLNRIDETARLIAIDSSNAPMAYRHKNAA